MVWKIDYVRERKRQRERQREREVKFRLLNYSLFLTKSIHL